MSDDFIPKGGTFGFFLMVCGMFMAILDIQIVAASLPDIQAGVAASLDEVTWVQTGYLVAEVVMIPLSGWLARVMSTRWLFTASSLGFTVMSLACGFAWDITSLIVFRALQGFLGGAMIPTVFAANFKLFPPQKQMIGTVVIGLTATVAPSIGPTLGGWLTEQLSWHWLFFANVIPGLLITIAVPMIVDIDRPNWSLARRIDLPGIVLVAGFLGSLEFVLDEGPRADWFDSHEILAFAVVSVLSGVLLFWRALTVEDPIVSFSPFRNRNFTVGCILTFVLGICIYGQSFILPQVLSRARGFNSLQIGQVMWVTGVAMFLTAPLAGRLSAMLDPRVMLAIGFPITAVGLWLNAHMTVEVGFAELVWAQILRGSGLVLCIVPITQAALGTLPLADVGNGSGLFNLFRNMGGALGLAMINTQWDGRYDRHYWWLAERLNNTSADVQDRLSGMAAAVGGGGVLRGDPDQMALQQMARIISGQSTIMAWNDVFWLMAVVAACSTPLVLLLAKPRAEQIAAH
ncbi:DHA2 family efflux MFS transporter permease subunit [Salipiger mangrovisoli]|uniref:DHA2 family efflux MFS transporter permease subunit n=1 Tax=Salipiger mangrovisoli TaxID=2865933 RepID=A0ABR9XAP8_9RHOB|nr:DHA2 family efflux MFS transporter permease subunit [Salipiger mangrovisoli]